MRSGVKTIYIAALITIDMKESNPVTVQKIHLKTLRFLFFFDVEEQLFLILITLIFNTKLYNFSVVTTKFPDYGTFASIKNSFWFFRGFLISCQCLVGCAVAMRGYDSICVT
jgi:hypothetical protein